MHSWTHCAIPEHGGTAWCSVILSPDFSSMLAGTTAVKSSAGAFPQNRSLAGALQEAQLGLVGRVMAVMPPAEQVRMLDGLKASIAGKAAKQRDARPDPQQQGATVRVCLAALTGVQALAELYKGKRHCSVCSNHMTEL